MKTSKTNQFLPIKGEVAKGRRGSLKYTEAYKLMERKDAQKKPIPFHIQWKTVDGRVVSAHVHHTVSYDKAKGSRRLILMNGGFRNIYDVLIRQIDDTRIVVS